MTACVDDSYDLDKDIDMTLGLGSNGLQLKLGTTEKVTLDDLLEADKEEMLGITDKNLYYLTKSGSADFNIHVDDVHVSINQATLTPDLQIIQPLPEPVTLPQGNIEVNPGTFAKDDFHFQVTNMKPSIKSVKRVVPEASSSRFTLRLEIVGPHSNDIRVSSIKNLKITFPEFIKSPDLDASRSYTIPSFTPNSNSVTLGSIRLDAIEMPGEKGKVAENGRFDLSGEVSMQGDFGLSAVRPIQMNQGDYVNVRLVIALGGNVGQDGYSTLDLKEVTGWFDPEINPEIDPVDISGDLPDFLSDPEVTIAVANPTIKFNFDLSQVPAGLDISGRLTAKKDGDVTTTVDMPSAGKASVDANRNNTVYFYEDNFHDPGEKGAFDPALDHVVSGSNTYEIQKLADLIRKLPDNIDVDLKNRHVTVQDKPYTIQLGRDYHAALDYDVLIPFNFDRGLKIVYNDSICDMNEDLQDYAAEGLEASAIIATTIPLDLQAELVALDVNGREIPSIHIDDSKAIVTASNGTDEQESTISFDITLDDPAALKLLDKLRFRIAAEAQKAQGSLTSKQYLQVKDMRLKLKGQIIGDFN